MPLTISKAIGDFYFERTKRNHFWTQGVEGQTRLKNLRIGIAGLGGMGSNIAEIFSRLGVGHFNLADNDIIEVSNINRQVIASIATIGEKKLDTSVKEIINIDPSITLNKFPEGINAQNADAFVEGMDVVINEIDVLHIQEQIHLLNAARKKGIPVYTTLVVGVGIHLYKYSPTSSFTPEDFLGSLIKDSSLENLLAVLGHPLPAYLQDGNLNDFIDEIKNRGGIPIFGASCYLGQSLLAIRVLNDLGYIRGGTSAPKTPELPEFLVLDPLTLELKTANVKIK